MGWVGSVTTSCSSVCASGECHRRRRSVTLSRRRPIPHPAVTAPPAVVYRLGRRCFFWTCLSVVNLSSYSYHFISFHFIPPSTSLLLSPVSSSISLSLSPSISFLPTLSHISFRSRPSSSLFTLLLGQLAVSGHFGASISHRSLSSLGFRGLHFGEGIIIIIISIISSSNTTTTTTRTRRPR